MSDLRLSGLATGLDTRALISQLMAFERRPVNMMEQVQAKTRSKIDLYRQINTKLVALQRAADKLKLQTFNAATPASAVSSDPTKLTATVGPSAASGTYAIDVLSLAQSQVISGGAFTAPALSISASNGNVSNLNVTSGAAVGTTTYALTAINHFRPQISTGGANSAATITATTTGSVTLTKQDGSTVSVALTTAENSRVKIAAAINAASSTIGISATLNGSKLVLTGSDGQTFSITGTARTLARIGFNSASTSTATVTANNVAATQAAARASVTVNGTLRTSSGFGDAFSSADLGLPGVSFDVAAVAANGSSANLTVTNTAGSLRITDTATSTAYDIAVTAGMSQLQVRDAINAANTGMTASIVSGQLQLTGTAGVTYTVADAGGGNALATSLGIDSATRTTQAAAAGSYRIDGGAIQSAGSNHIAGALTGVDLDLVGVGSATLTVTAGVGSVTAADLAEKSATLDAVKGLVTAFNDALAFIKQHMSYDAGTKKAGALLGDTLARNLRSGLTRMVSDIVDDSAAFRSASAAGIELQRDGSFTLDEAKLASALETNAAALKNLFLREDNLTYTDGNGYAVKVNSVGQSAGAAGDGIANRLSAYVEMLVTNSSLYNVTDASGQRTRGALLGKVDTLERQVSDLDQRIEDYTRRLAGKERLLRQKFQAMEKVVAMMRNQGNYMATQYMGLSQQA